MEHYGSPLLTWPPGSGRDAMDRALLDLHAAKDAWVTIPVANRVQLLERLIQGWPSVADRWISGCLKAKGLPSDGIAAAQEVIAGPYTITRTLRRLKRALRDIEIQGAPRVPGPITTTAGGQLVARVVPQDVYDRIFFPGVTMEVWMQPGVTRQDLAATQAVHYRQPPTGKVALVLGGGNVSGIPPTDALYKLFVENQVVLLKMSPVNAYVGPLLGEWFQPLVEGGFLRIVYGDASDGEYLCSHPEISDIWITGSDRTFDAIVFGNDTAKSKARIDKPIVGELGNVCPVIVVPGPWNDADLSYHAELIATGVTENAGFTCSIPRVIIQHAAWDRRADFLDQLRFVLAKVPLRDAYYPGSSERRNEYLREHPEAESFGTPTGRQLPWTMVSGLDPENVNDICFKKEAFFGFVAETEISAPDPASFVERAVAFANEHLWGTLSAIILVHPASLKLPAVAAAVERAIKNLRYGTIAVNYIAGANWAAGSTPWGAFPNTNIRDIQSGNGFVHNALMFDRAQKVIERAPFRARPKPVWFASRGRTAKRVFEMLIDFEMNPSAWKVPGIVLSALRD